MATRKTAKKPAPAKKVAAKKAAGKDPAAAQSKTSAEQRRKMFIEALLSNGENATQAALAAGFSEKSAASQASRLLKNVKVQQELDRRRNEAIAKVQKDTGITLERTLREIARGAFFDVRRLFNDDGTPKGIHELDDDTASVIAGLDVAEEFGPVGTKAGMEPQAHGGSLKRQQRGLEAVVRKYKLADRKGYLDMLMKHLGGYKKDNEQGGEAAANALGSLLAHMRASALPVVRNPAE